VVVIARSLPCCVVAGRILDDRREIVTAPVTSFKESVISVRLASARAGPAGPAAVIITADCVGWATSAQRQSPAHGLCNTLVRSLFRETLAVLPS